MAHALNDSDRNRRRFGKADDELVSFFSAAIGVRAQNYDSSGGGTDPNEWHYGRLRSMQRGELARFDRIAATLRQLPSAARVVLVAVYTPHAAPTWLQDALSPPWGGGSFVALAQTTPRAALAAMNREPGQTVLDWLAQRGRRAKDPLLQSLRDDCEVSRLAALEAYEPLRVARIKADQVRDRDAAESRSRRNQELFSELVGRRTAKERQRIARRTGIGP